MVGIAILQKIQAEADRHLGQLRSGASRVYEISTAGTIVERTHQVRDFYELVARQLEHVIGLLRAGAGAGAGAGAEAGAGDGGD